MESSIKLKILCVFKLKEWVFTLKRILTKLKSPPIQVSLHLFNTMAKPLLCYGCEIWGFHKGNEIERVELNYMKYILYLARNATSTAVQGELGQFPIHLFWIENIIKYWCRANINTHELPYYLQQSFKVQREMFEKGRNCWLSRVNQLYYTAGLPIRFNMSGNENSKAHVNEIMTQFSDQFIQDWLGQINAPEGRKSNMSNKLRTYKLFKDEFQLEDYLKCQLSIKHRAALTKLRVSCHKLAIETGRYHKPAPLPVAQRLCSVCDVIEDEIHFICDCIRNAHLRWKLFSSVSAQFTHFPSLNSLEKFILLMRLNDTYLIRELASFIHASFLLAT